MRSAGMLGLLVAAALGEVAAVAQPLEVKKMNIQRTTPTKRQGRQITQAKGAVTGPIPTEGEAAEWNKRIDAQKAAKKARRQKA